MLRVLGLVCRFFLFLMANNVDLDQRPYCLAPDLGLHCLPMTHLRDSS